MQKKLKGLIDISQVKFPKKYQQFQCFKEDPELQCKK